MNTQGFIAHLGKTFPYITTKNTRLLLAVSGGVDSVVLTDLFANAGFDFVIAHCNFHLRAEESNRDEAFVKELAQKYDKTLVVKHFQTEEIAQSTKKSIEETARNLRYDWFAQLLNDELYFPEKNIDKYVVTAHHANDTIETLLMNFFRGTGISGLHGIPEKNKHIIRPLLFAGRQDILNYAESNKLHWVEDSTNSLEIYTRNFFRNNLLPSVENYFPKVQDSLLANIQRFKEVEILYQQAVSANKKKLLQWRGKECFIPILLLQKTPALATLLWEILKEFSFSQRQITEVVKLLSAENGARVDATTHRIFKNRAHLIITAIEPTNSAQIMIDQVCQSVIFEEGKLEINTIEKPTVINQKSTVALLDKKDIVFPLILRKWKEGDYFYPLGMNKKKKLSRFFIDNKLSLSEKEKTWVIESNKKIVWVVGWRIDNRYKITANTQSVLKLQMVK